MNRQGPDHPRDPVGDPFPRRRRSRCRAGLPDAASARSSLPRRTPPWSYMSGSVDPERCPLRASPTLRVRRVPPVPSPAKARYVSVCAHTGRTASQPPGARTLEVPHDPLQPADLSALLSTAVEQALRAPSVHNTQPWRWRITSGSSCTPTGTATLRRPTGPTRPPAELRRRGTRALVNDVRATAVVAVAIGIGLAELVGRSRASRGQAGPGSERPDAPFGVRGTVLALAVGLVSREVPQSGFCW